MNLADIERAVARLKEYEIPVSRVETWEEAVAFTEVDPFGHVWSVGDRYYLVPVAPGMKL